MILLDGVELNPNLTWSERFISQGITQVARFTLGGRLVVNASPLLGGTLITLVASEDSGWLSKPQFEFLRGLSTQPGRVMSLSFHGDFTNKQVIFRHHENPALDIRPLTPKWEPEAGDYFIGTIKLMSI